ncbi:myo-inosose-2 dehydratase [Mesomycoplasma hyopneumoniae]|uniref:myo-inosose-2 dehydratase n=1 Tax=Mesomycoplasma hyopneumoniae TaxID=2099 RepID=UPI0015C5C92F|nr:myo-inosose-2 dehydratase [Mesomycoplasma hyopneumoniae]QLG43353.1 myo-inosose-2 dehydratase [Mesomycoplasma hyopneumoniae]
MNKIWKLKNVKVGVAPILWTNDDMPELGGDISFDRAISEMAQAGYQGTEIGNKFPKDAKILLMELKKYNLEIASAWFSGYIISDFEKNFQDFQKHCLFLKALGAKVVVFSEQTYSIQGQNKPLFKDKPYFTNQEFENLAQGLNKFGRWSKQHGIELVYHHHMGTGIQSLKETEKILELTDPEFVSLIFDTGHFAHAGEDIVFCLKRLISRIRHIHLKDIRKEKIDELKAKNLSFLEGVKQGIFTVPGDGDIQNYPLFFELLAKNNYQGWLIVEAEQDPRKANPLEYAKKAMDYLRSLISW